MRPDNRRVRRALLRENLAEYGWRLRQRYQRLLNSDRARRHGVGQGNQPWTAFPPLEYGSENNYSSIFSRGQS